MPSPPDGLCSRRGRDIALVLGVAASLRADGGQRRLRRYSFSAFAACSTTVSLQTDPGLLPVSAQSMAV